MESPNCRQIIEARHDCFILEKNILLLVKVIILDYLCSIQFTAFIIEGYIVVYLSLLKIRLFTALKMSNIHSFIYSADDCYFYTGLYMNEIIYIYAT